MKVLVTGHDGYLGAVMTPLLAAAGHDVIGLDTGLFRAFTLGDQAPEIPTIAKDVRDVSPDDLDGLDAVIHLAAISNDPVGNLDPELTFEVNHRASVRLAETAKRAHVPRFLYSSSCSTYGAAEGDSTVDERSEFNPVTPYGRSKVLAGLEAPREAIHNEAFNVGRDDDNHQIRDVARMIEATVPDATVTPANGAGPDTRTYRVSFAKVTQDLPGFEPKWTVQRGIEELLATYAAYGLTLEDFLSSHFQRITRIRELLDAGELDADLRWQAR